MSVIAAPLLCFFDPLHATDETGATAHLLPSAKIWARQAL